MKTFGLKKLQRARRPASGIPYRDAVPEVVELREVFRTFDYCDR